METEELINRLADLIERSEQRIDRTNDMVCRLVSMAANNEERMTKTVDTLNNTVTICHDLQRQLAEAQKEIERTRRNFEEVMKAYVGCIRSENNFNIHK